MANSKRKYKNIKITQSAKGEECQVRYPNHCNFNSETTIFAHKGGGGMGIKSSEIHGAYCCSSCHDIYDNRVRDKSLSRIVIDCYFYEGIFRTQQILLGKGLIKT